MPWATGTAEESRARFVVEALQSAESFAAVCRKHGISRETGYRWVERYDVVSTLSVRCIRSCAPFSCGEADH